MKMQPDYIETEDGKKKDAELYEGMLSVSSANYLADLAAVRTGLLHGLSLKGLLDSVRNPSVSRYFLGV